MQRASRTRGSTQTWGNRPELVRAGLYSEFGEPAEARQRAPGRGAQERDGSREFRSRQFRGASRLDERARQPCPSAWRAADLPALHAGLGGNPEGPLLAEVFRTLARRSGLSAKGLQDAALYPDFGEPVEAGQGGALPGVWGTGRSSPARFRTRLRDGGSEIRG